MRVGFLGLAKGLSRLATIGNGPMKRRGFLRGVAALSLGGAAASACGPVILKPANISSLKIQAQPGELVVLDLDSVGLTSQIRDKASVAVLEGSNMYLTFEIKFDEEARNLRLGLIIKDEGSVKLRTYAAKLSPAKPNGFQKLSIPLDLFYSLADIWRLREIRFALNQASNIEVKNFQFEEN